MKRKSKRQNVKKKKEFRFHQVETINSQGKMIKIWHPSYIFLEKGNVYIYVSITHSNAVEEFVVIELRENPNPKDKRNSFWIAKIKEDTKDRFGKRRKGWKINELDDQDIRNKYKKR